MTEHVVEASPQTVHWGYFEATLPPVLRVRPGDRVTMRTVSGGADVTPQAGFAVLPAHRAIQAEVSRRMLPGHILTGPVAVEGAEPGDTLEVRILDIRLAVDWGWNVIRPLVGTLPEDFPDHRLCHLPLDLERKVARLPWGIELPLRPFFGVMGVAPPAAWGTQSSIVPRAFGGNLDLKELVPGTTLFLPVFQPGALFSVGDGHAAQGDGEVNVTAIETSLDGTFELHLRKGEKLAGPRAETPTHYITLGTDPDLDDAAKFALREMIALVRARANISAEDAYMLCSIAADLRVTQLVNQHKGIHVMLEKRLVHGG